MEKKTVFYAGAARRDITPKEDMLPMPYVGPVAFEAVADRISVRALYLENGDGQVLFVHFDLAEVPYVQETVAALTRFSGLPSERIFTVATHTHSMPFFGTVLFPPDAATEPLFRRYYDYVMEKAEEAVREAMDGKRPAKLGYGEGRSYVNVNRDEKIDGKYTYGNNFERPSDKTLQLMRLEDEEGQMIALIVNFAVHAVVTNGCMIGDGLWLGGDLPGRTATALEKKLGGVSLWTPAASGDQNPRYCTNFGYDETSPTLRTISPGEGGYLYLDALVAEHVRDILAANAGFTCDRERISIATAEQTVLVQAKEELAAVMPAVPFVLKLLRLGDLVIQGVSAEVVTTVGAAMRSISDGEHTMMMTHVHGTGLYVPDEWEYAVQAQEVSQSLLARGAAEPVFAAAFAEMVKNTK